MAVACSILNTTLRHWYPRYWSDLGSRHVDRRASNLKIRQYTTTLPCTKLLTLMKLHDPTSAPEPRHAEHGLPSPLSPLHLILRLRQRVHFAIVSLCTRLEAESKANRYRDPPPCLLIRWSGLMLKDRGVESRLRRIFYIWVVLIRMMAVVGVGYRASVIGATSRHRSWMMPEDRTWWRWRRVDVGTAIVGVCHHHFEDPRSTIPANTLEKTAGRNKIR